MSRLFKLAACTIVPFGAYRGKTLDEIAKTDKGLKYLDWLLGQDWVYEDLKEHLGVYLKDPSIAKELENLRD